MANGTVVRRLELMGYRSEVAIALTRNLFEEIKSELEEDDQDDLDTAIVEESKEQVLLHFKSIKWYDIYRLVTVIESNILKKLSLTVL